MLTLNYPVIPVYMYTVTVLDTISQLKVYALWFYRNDTAYTCLIVSN